MQIIQSCDPMHRIAHQVADCLSESGYAFIEDDKLEALAAALTSFLNEADVPINKVSWQLSTTPGESCN